MINWPILTNLKALRSFLGLIGYYRKFIKHYYLIVGPLTTLLKKDGFVWSTTANKAFQNLKLAMSHPLVLSLTDFTKNFVIECDVSDVGIGAVLMQNNMPIAFLNQALKGRHLSLSTHEKELLALVVAVKK